MRYQKPFWLCFTCAVVFFTACSNNTTPTLNTAGIEQILVVDKSTLSFSSQRLAPQPASQFISARYYGDHLLVQPLGDLPEWLTMDVNENPNQKLTLLQFDVGTTKLQAGQYSAAVRLVVYDQRAFGKKAIGFKDLQIKLQISDEFSINEKQIDFYSVLGDSAGLSQSVHLYGSGSAWVAHTDQPWLQLSRSEGSGTAEISINVISKHKALHAGRQSAQVTFKDRYSEHEVQIPVSLLLEPPRLYVAEHGVAFTQLYNKSHVTRDIDVFSNTEIPVRWYAVSNRNWLQVDQSKDGKTLSLRANPARLPAGLHYATITVRAQTPATNRETIDVGFFVNGGVKQAKSVIPLSKPSESSDMVTDPIRPYVYIGTAGEIHRYNIYTGEEHSYSDMGKAIAALAISSDGRFLYLADNNDFSIRVFDLEQEKMHAIWNGPRYNGAKNKSVTPRLVYLRSSGFPIVLTNSFHAYDARNGDLVARFTPHAKPGELCCESQLPYIVASRGGTSFYVQERGDNSQEIFRFDIHYSHIKGVGLKIEQTGFLSNSGAALDLAVSNDGAEVCTITSGENLSRCYFGPTITPSRVLRLGNKPNNIEFGALGDIYAAYQGKKKPGIWRFNAISGKRGTFYRLKSEIDAGQMLLSGDNLSIVTLNPQKKSLTLVSTR